MNTPASGAAAHKPENMLKGRIAETLIEEMLKASGNAVYRFGYEAIIQNLTQLKKGVEKWADWGADGERIRAMPDFIVVDKDGATSFVEVKYRWDGKSHDDDGEKLAKIHELWNAKIIIVNSLSKPYFRVLKAPYLGENGALEYLPMKNVEGWGIDPTKYDDYEGLVERYLKGAYFAQESKAPGA